MKKIGIFCLIAFASFNAFSQTKKIAHRSHSGKDNTLILTTEDNFGIPVYTKKDTVTVKKDSTVRKTTANNPAKKYIKKKKKHTTTAKPPTPTHSL